MRFVRQSSRSATTPYRLAPVLILLGLVLSSLVLTGCLSGLAAAGSSPPTPTPTPTPTRTPPGLSPSPSRDPGTTSPSPSPSPSTSPSPSGTPAATPTPSASPSGSRDGMVNHHPEPPERSSAASPAGGIRIERESQAPAGVAANRDRRLVAPMPSSVTVDVAQALIVGGVVGFVTSTIAMVVVGLVRRRL